MNIIKWIFSLFKCYGESSTMKRSSGPFNNFDKCQQEEKKLVCTDQSHVKTCIRDIDGKSLWAVCTRNICFYGKYVNVTLHPSWNYNWIVRVLLSGIKFWPLSCAAFPFDIYSIGELWFHVSVLVLLCTVQFGLCHT